MRRHGSGCLDTGGSDGGFGVAEAAGKGGNHLRKVRRQSITVRMRHQSQKAYALPTIRRLGRRIGAVEAVKKRTDGIGG